jgi:tetratricopeptide (TPR) repeat protein
MKPVAWATATVGAGVVAVLAALAAPTYAAAPRGDAEQALRTGRYEQARRLACGTGRGRGATDGATLLSCARAELALGRLNDARKRLEAAVEARPDDLPARDMLMRLYDAVGDRAALAPLVDASYADWNGGKVARNRAPDLIAIATAVRLDGNWKDANDVLRDAVRANPRATAANLDWGDVLLQKHNAADAEAAFQDVLKIDPDNPDAHFGLARVAVADRYDGAAALEHIGRALAINPAHAGALALRGSLALDAENWAAAAADVAAIRRTNPQDAGAARVAAASAMLRDDRTGYERARDAALAVRPNDGAFFAAVAETLTHHRRYDDARDVAREGVTLDPDDADCLAVLAMTLLRLGDEEAGLDTLRRAWKRDPYDVRTYNLLNLFEKVIPARYATVSGARLRFRVPTADRAAIAEVVAPYLEERYRELAARYRVEPAGPVTFELFAEPREFAVRTTGLPAIGVAGVCFGRVITSQAPSNHAFNWGMVLTHELAHVFAIHLSRSRVPRWFTEGLSEMESARLRPEWTRHDDAALYAALRRGDLPPLLSLSNAFITSRGDEAARAYAHAAVAVDFLERRFGFPALREALVAFGRGEAEAAVIGKMTGLSAEALEREFRAELTRRFARYDKQYLPPEPARVAGPASPAPKTTGARAVVARGLGALRSGDVDEAKRALERARALPQPSADDQADTLFLAGEIALARRDADAAIAAFEALLDAGAAARDGYDVRVRLGLAEIHRKRSAAAEAHLRRAIELDPGRLEPHALLAELYKSQSRTPERLAALAAAMRLDPQTDRIAKEAVLGEAKAGRPARVIELAPMAIFIDPASPDLHAALGRALAATGKTAAGAAALERALAFGPESPALLHLELAALYETLGDRKRAAAHRAAGSGGR